MTPDEINVCAVAIAKAVNQNMSKREINEFVALLSQILCNLGIYRRFD